MGRSITNTALICRVNLVSVAGIHRVKMVTWSSLLTRVKVALLSGEAESSVKYAFSDDVLNPEVSKKLRRTSKVVVFVFMIFSFL